MKKWIIRIILVALSIIFLTNSYYINRLSTRIDEAKVYLFPLPISVEIKSTMLPLLSKFYLYMGIGTVVITLIYLFFLLRREKKS